MSSGANFFLKKTLGDDFFESLTKFELWKPGTRTTIDHEEIKTALKIVPRALMSFLIHNLTSMEIGETKELQIPVSEKPAMLRVTKHERDVYSGELEQNNKKIVDLKYRSIPGVGLVVMSALELYDTEKLSEESEHTGQKDDVLGQVQKMIDDRLALHDLIGKVVDKKIQQRDAIQQLILAKLSNGEKHEEKIHPNPHMIENKSKELLDAGPSYPKQEHYEKVMRAGFKEGVKAARKGSPVHGFLEERKNKLHKKEYSIQLSKNQNVSCPDCGQSIFKNEAYSGCVCMGENMDSKVYITKSEDGVKVRFGKGWDADNIEMLLEVLRGKRG